jgi:hypothetical protein
MIIPSVGEPIITGGGDFWLICGKHLAFSGYMKYNIGKD